MVEASDNYKKASVILDQHFYKNNVYKFISSGVGNHKNFK